LERCAQVSDGVTNLIYDSSNKKNPAIEEIFEAFRYRDLIGQLIRRDLTTRYKRSVLGIIWTMLHPLGLMIIMTLVFQNLFHRQEFYSVYVLTGLLTFGFFNQTSSTIIRNLTWGAELFQRIYIPRASFAIAAVGTAIINLVLSVVPLLLVKLIIQSPISWQVVLFPISVVYLACFSLGMGLIVSSIALYFHDVAEFYQVLLTAWMYATPIIYPYDTLPDSVKQIMVFNPMMHIVELMRASFYYVDKTPSLSEFLLVAAISFITLIVGWFLFARQAEQFVLRG
jgi:ABC-type polysaccharide/polyol phosphate export permease